VGKSKLLSSRDCSVLTNKLSSKTFHQTTPDVYTNIYSEILLNGRVFFWYDLSMKIKSLISKQATLLLILAISFATLFLPLASLQAATLTDGMDASYVLGQDNFTDVSGNKGAAISDDGLNRQKSIAYDNTNSRLFVADLTNKRVLVWDLSIGITDGMSASYVLGQADFTSTVATVTQSGMQSPNYIKYDSANDYLYVSDSTNNRVTVYDVATIVNGENAINVLGQADFTSSGNTSTQSGMSAPSGLELVSNTLYVSDGSNNRVLTYDVSTITNGENAVNVLGQPDFVSSTATITQSGLSGSAGLTYDPDNSRLFVSGNSRVTVYDVASISDGENAVYVLGEPDFVTNSGLVSTSSSTISGAIDVHFDTNSRLFVGDSAKTRVLIFDLSSGITNGMGASNVLGRANFTDALPQLRSQSALFSAAGLDYDTTNDYLFVSDGNANRVIIYDLSATVSSSSTGRGYIHPPLCTATITPQTITEGETATLSWNTTWPTENQNNYYAKVPGEGLYSSNVNSVTIQPKHSTNYIMTLFNLWGANFCEASIEVLTSDGEELTSERNSTLTAGVSNSPFVRAISNFFRSIFSR
jgi:hypothetical protein